MHLSRLAAVLPFFCAFAAFACGATDETGSTNPQGGSSSALASGNEPAPTSPQGESSSPPASGDEPAPTAASGGVCGTRGAYACAEGLLCHYAPEAQCGVTDAPGTCIDPHEGPQYRCMTDTVGKGVCGCSGRWYPNDCLLETAHDSVDLDERCMH